MKIIIYALSFLLLQSAFATTEIDRFECGIYELNGKIVEGDGSILTFMMYPKTKKEYQIKISAPYLYLKKIMDKNPMISKIKVQVLSEGLASQIKPIALAEPQSGNPNLEKVNNFKKLKALACQK
jgi:hypothetical protein